MRGDRETTPAKRAGRKFRMTGTLTLETTSSFYTFKLKNNSEKMEPTEVEKAKALIIDKIIEYVPNSVVIKTIIKKTTGDISAASFDTGEAMTEKTIPFDTFVQIIEGKAEIIIDGVSNELDAGQSIIIPANSSNIVKANERFKMISNIIKSDLD